MTTSAAKKAAPQSLKIIGSLFSPFVRITRVVCEELGLPYEMEVTPPYKQWVADKEKDAFIRSHNPLMKIPILIDGDVSILDSRLIASHLWKRKAGKTGFRGPTGEAEEDNLITVIYGVIDAAVLWYVIGVANPEVNKSHGYMARSMERIGHGLQWLNRQEDLGKSFGLSETALICGLEWITKRKVFEWEKLGKLSQVYKTYCDRPSLVKTRIPETYNP